MSERGSREEALSPEASDYKTQNAILANEAVEVVAALTGEQEWSGDEPYEVRVADAADRIAYLISIRKGPDWVTIQRQQTDNPALVKTFRLKKKGATWAYDDPYMIKYNQSSLPELESALDLLKRALAASRPHEIEGEIEE